MKHFDVREALIESGRREFLDKGFEKASLRTICRGAGVTTGAFYSHFSRKEDLFDAIVADVLAEHHQIFPSLVPEVLDDFETVAKSEWDSMRFMLRHRDVFKLLLDCSQGTSYENTKAEVLAALEGVYRKIFDCLFEGGVDPDLVRIYVKMRFLQYTEIIYGNYDEEKVDLLSKNLSVIMQGGLKALVDSLDA